MLVSEPVQLTSSRNIGPSERGKEFGPVVIASVGNDILQCKSGGGEGVKGLLPQKSISLTQLLPPKHEQESCPL